MVESTEGVVSGQTPESLVLAQMKISGVEKSERHIVWECSGGTAKQEEKMKTVNVIRFLLNGVVGMRFHVRGV